MRGINQFESLNFDKIKERIETQSNLKVLPSEYVNHHSYIKLTCECGNQFKASYRKLRENKFKTVCKECRSAIRSAKILKDTENKFSEYVKNTEEYELIEYRGSREKSKLLHSKCGNVLYMRSDVFMKGCRCYCDMSSKGERAIIEILNELNVNYREEYSFKDLKSVKNFPLRFDFAIFKENEILFLIEFNGVQHYDENNWLNLEKDGFNYRVANDTMKKDYCMKNGYPLLIVPYNKIEKTKQLIINMLISSQATESQ